jgi:hypothetical protein
MKRLRWLGHHDISTIADIYGHSDFQAKKNIAERVGKIFNAN